MPMNLNAKTKIARKDTALSLRQRVHPRFKRAVRGAEVLVGWNGFGHLESRGLGGNLKSKAEGGIMAKRRRSSLALSGEHARQALAILVEEGKLKASEVKKALKRRERLVRALRASLAALEAGVVSTGKRLNGSSPMARLTRKAERKMARGKRRISAATRKMYQQQGRYMTAVRRLPKAARAKIKAIREKSGVRAAIAAAKKRAT
jgi:hypothetical protein